MADGPSTQGKGNTPSSGAVRPEDLTPADLERLTELVYRLLRNDVLMHRERRGAFTAHWR